MEPITITLCLLVFAIAMFVWEKVPLAVTSMIVCVALVITGVLNVKQALAVLSTITSFYLLRCLLLAVRYSKPEWRIK